MTRQAPAQAPRATTDAEGHPHRWLVLACTSLALLVVVLGNTVLNVALPQIGNAVDATSSELQWFLDAYILVFAAFLLTGGALGDRFGRRRAFTIGLVVLIVGSLIAAVLGSAAGLVLGRAVMGLGASLVMPSTLAIVNDVFPARQRGQALAVWSSVAALGVATGPVLGGWLVEHHGWGSLFLVNVPVAVVAVAAALVVIPESRSAVGGRVDVLGLTLSIVAVGSVVEAIVSAPVHGLLSVHVGVALAVGLVAGAWFIRSQLSAPRPMIPLVLLQRAGLSAPGAVLFVANFALMGFIFFYSLYTQMVLGFSPSMTGLTIIPAALAIMLAAAASAALQQRHGAKVVTAVGLAVVSAAMLLIGRLSPGTGLAELITAQVLMGIGMGLLSTPATASMMASVDRADAGFASAFGDVSRELGALFGIAVMGSVMSWRYAHGIAISGEVPAHLVPDASDSFLAAARIAERLGAADGAALIDVATDALTQGVAVAALVGAVATAAGVVLALATVPSGGPDPRRPPTDPEATVTVGPRVESRR